MPSENSTIKDFIKKQTTGISIAQPMKKPVVAAADAPAEQGREEAAAAEAAPASSSTVLEGAKVRGHVGRPKSEIEKVKLSVYVPAEAKAKLIRIQHHNYKSNLNDVLIEAITDLIRKYGE